MTATCRNVGTFRHAPALCNSPSPLYLSLTCGFSAYGSPQIDRERAALSERSDKFRHSTTPKEHQ